MRLELTGRHVQSTLTLRRLIERKLARLERMLNDSAVSAQVVLTREKRTCRVDITLHARGEQFLHGAGESAKWETSVAEAVSKIAHQAKTLKGKWQERKRHSGLARTSPAIPTLAGASGGVSRGRAVAPIAHGLPATRRPPAVPRILRAAVQPLKSMSARDAAREVQASRDGVLVFRDVDTRTLSVLFRRSNGQLMLVPTDM